MIEMRFVDTNVLLYLLETDTSKPAKFLRASEILQAPDLALSIQVLQEFYTQATRPTNIHRISREFAAAYLDSFRRYPIQEITLSVFEAALATCQRYQISYWDAAIVEAARTLGCDTILTEDLKDGQDFGGLRVVNPFATI